MINILINEKNFYIALFIVVIIDLITGVTNALLKKEFSSSKLRSGLSKDISYFAFSIVGVILEYCFDVEIAHLFILTTVAIESLSILENVEKITGIKIVDKIKSLIKGVSNVDI